MTVEQTSSQSHIHSLAKFYATGRYSDALLRVKSSSDSVPSIPVHRIVLASQSAYFDTLFSTPQEAGISDGSTTPITMDSPHPEENFQMAQEHTTHTVPLRGRQEECDVALRLAVEWMYFGEANLSIVSVWGVLDAARLFEIPTLVSKCEGFVDRLLTAVETKWAEGRRRVGDSSDCDEVEYCADAKLTGWEEAVLRAVRIGVSGIVIDRMAAAAVMERLILANPKRIKTKSRDDAAKEIPSSNSSMMAVRSRASSPGTSGTGFYDEEVDSDSESSELEDGREANDVAEPRSHRRTVAPTRAFHAYALLRALVENHDSEGDVLTHDELAAIFAAVPFDRFRYNELEEVRLDERLPRSVVADALMSGLRKREEQRTHMRRTVVAVIRTVGMMAGSMVNNNGGAMAASSGNASSSTSSKTLSGADAPVADEEKFEVLSSPMVSSAGKEPAQNGGADRIASDDEDMGGGTIRVSQLLSSSSHFRNVAQTNYNPLVPPSTIVSASRGSLDECRIDDGMATVRGGRDGRLARSAPRRIRAPLSVDLFVNGEEEAIHAGRKDSGRKTSPALKLSSDAIRVSGSTSTNAKVATLPDENFDNEVAGTLRGVPISHHSIRQSDISDMNQSFFLAPNPGRGGSLRGSSIAPRLESVPEEAVVPEKTNIGNGHTELVQEDLTHHSERSEKTALGTSTAGSEEQTNSEVTEFVEISQDGIDDQLVANNKAILRDDTSTNVDNDSPAFKSEGIDESPARALRKKRAQELFPRLLEDLPSGTARPGSMGTAQSFEDIEVCPEIVAPVPLAVTNTAPDTVKFGSGNSDEQRKSLSVPNRLSATPGLVSGPPLNSHQSETKDTDSAVPPSNTVKIYSLQQSQQTLMPMQPADGPTFNQKDVGPPAPAGPSIVRKVPTPELLDAVAEKLKMHVRMTEGGVDVPNASSHEPDAKRTALSAGNSLATRKPAHSLYPLLKLDKGNSEVIISHPKTPPTTYPQAVSTEDSVFTVESAIGLSTSVTKRDGRRNTWCGAHDEEELEEMSEINDRIVPYAGPKIVKRASANSLPTPGRSMHESPRSLVKSRTHMRSSTRSSSSSDHLSPDTKSLEEDKAISPRRDSEDGDEYSEANRTMTTTNTILQRLRRQKASSDVRARQREISQRRPGNLRKARSATAFLSGGSRASSNTSSSSSSQNTSIILASAPVLEGPTVSSVETSSSYSSALPEKVLQLLPPPMQELPVPPPHNRRTTYSSRFGQQSSNLPPYNNQVADPQFQERRQHEPVESVRPATPSALLMGVLNSEVSSMPPTPPPRSRRGSVDTTIISGDRFSMSAGKCRSVSTLPPSEDDCMRETSFEESMSVLGDSSFHWPDTGKTTAAPLTASESSAKSRVEVNASTKEIVEVPEIGKGRVKGIITSVAGGGKHIATVETWGPSSNPFSLSGQKRGSILFNHNNTRTNGAGSKGIAPSTLATPMSEDGGARLSDTIGASISGSMGHHGGSAMRSDASVKIRNVLDSSSLGAPAVSEDKENNSGDESSESSGFKVYAVKNVTRGDAPPKVTTLQSSASSISSFSSGRSVLGSSFGGGFTANSNGRGSHGRYTLNRKNIKDFVGSVFKF